MPRFARADLGVQATRPPAQSWPLTSSSMAAMRARQGSYARSAPSDGRSRLRSQSAATRLPLKALDGPSMRSEPLKNYDAVFASPPGRRQRGRWGSLVGEVKEGMARRARGDRSQSESPTDL